MASESEIRVAHKRAVGGGRKRCSKGKNCSAACIQRSESCLVEIPLSPSEATRKLRDKIVESKQLSLFDGSKYVSADKLKEIVDEKDAKIKKGIRDAIKEDDKDKYEGWRSKALKLNRELASGDYANKVEPVKVPVSWERFKKVEESYYKAANSIEDKMREVAERGDKGAYDKLERRLMAVQDKLGKRVGDEQLRKPGEIWESMREARQERTGVKFASELERDLLSRGHRNLNVFYDGGEVSITKQIGDHLIEAQMAKNGREFIFLVDGAVRARSGISRENKVMIIQDLKDIFSTAISKMDEGSVIEVTAFSSDGKGAARKRAYEKFGFAEDGGRLYGKVVGGKLVPSSYGEFSVFSGEGNFNF